MYSALRRAARSSKNPSGTTSMPLAANQVLADSASTSKPAANANGQLKKRRLARNTSRAWPNRLAKPKHQVSATSPAPEAPSHSAGVSRAGHKRLVAPATRGAPAAYSKGRKLAKLRANWKWM